MDFVDWCGGVLQLLMDQVGRSPEAAEYGLITQALANTLFGPSASADFARTHALSAALNELQELGWIVFDGGVTKVPRLAQAVLDDVTPYWEATCSHALSDRERSALVLVNRLSQQTGDEYSSVEDVSRDVVLGEMGDQEDEPWIRVALRQLDDLGLVSLRGYMGKHFEVRSTYNGLVWETKRAYTLESRFIDEKVAEWETTNVEFKSDVQTSTNDEKAELVKDVLGLVNTQASGKRWLIIGFDDKTHNYCGEPNTKLTQNHLEQLFSVYTEPMMQVVCNRLQYRSGPVIKIEVMRNAKHLPYHVMKEIRGAKKHIEVGDIFVRHGSQTEKPTPKELQALIDEATRANASP